MPLYRKKPIDVQAEQFFSSQKPWPKGVYKLQNAGVENKFHENRVFKIDTPEGSLNVKEGDWIITGVKGEKYPCDQDIFGMTYDPIKEH